MTWASYITLFLYYQDNKIVDQKINSGYVNKYTGLIVT